MNKNVRGSALLERIKSIVNSYQHQNNTKITKFRIIKQPSIQVPNVLLECATENSTTILLDSGIRLEEANSMYSEFIDIANKGFIEY